MILLVLSACNTPGPHFRNASPVRIEVGGAVFDVRTRDDLAEAIRVNAKYAPRLGPIKAKATRAIERVTGCKAKRVTGDQALLRAELDCAGRPPARLAPGGTYRDFECLQTETFVRPSTNESVQELDCTPIR